jgi:hypothetical protein
MFRLYRKSGFNVDKALVALREVIVFRVEHFYELTWLPDPLTHSPISGIPSSDGEGSATKRRSSSRTSAQSPLPTPSPEDELSDTMGISQVEVIDSIGHISGLSATTTLLQLYPCSSKDPNRRPLAVVSLKYLQEDDESSRSRGRDGTPIPATIKQAIAFFERLRLYLYHDAKETREQTLERRDALQFILIIDLAEGRVTSTVRGFG